MAAVKVCYSSGVFGQIAHSSSVSLSGAKRRLGFPALYKIGLGNPSRSSAGPEVLSSSGLTLKLVLLPAACTPAPALAWAT